MSRRGSTGGETPEVGRRRAFQYRERAPSRLPRRFRFGRLIERASGYSFHVTIEIAASWYGWRLVRRIGDRLVYDAPTGARDGVRDPDRLIREVEKALRRRARTIKPERGR
jgi:hypothetical protein